MRWWSRIVVTSFVSFGIAFGLSLLPLMEQGERKTQEDITVFKSTELRQISDRNLVDYMLGLSLRTQIIKVDWEHSILTVDLKAANDQKVENILKDVFDLSYYGLVGTTNIKQVLVRVMDDGKDGAHRNGALLLAMDARRDHISLDALQRLKHKETTLEQYLDTYFAMTYTKEWYARFSIKP
jgi:hypothetical protein